MKQNELNSKDLVVLYLEVPEYILQLIGIQSLY